MNTEQKQEIKDGISYTETPMYGVKHIRGSTWNEVDPCDRNATIKAIKAALQRRSGKAWSVTGGRGTAWGWIRIDAPPARRTSHSRLKAGATNEWPESWEQVNTGEAGGFTTVEDRNELANLLGLETAHFQGVSIPASSEYRREYLDRAQGKTPSVIATPYWD